MEYTAPYGLFGDQEIILITYPGQDDDVGVKRQIFTVKGQVAIVPPLLYGFFSPGISRFKNR